MPSFRLSAASVGVQPAAELRHLQCHGHDHHVLRALLPMPFPQSSVEPSPARCVHRGRPPPPASRSAPRPASHALLSTLGTAGREGVQPAAELRHLQRHEHGRHVLRALRAYPASNLQSSPLLHAACTADARHLRPPGLRLAPHHMRSFRLSAGSVGVQPAAELRHLQRYEHEPDVSSTLLPVRCPNLQSSPLLHAAGTAVVRRLPPADQCKLLASLLPAASCLPARSSRRTVCSPRDSAGRKLSVRRQRAAHWLRVGGYLVL